LREKLREILKQKKIKFVLDIHGLEKSRSIDFDIADLEGGALKPFDAL